MVVPGRGTDCFSRPTLVLFGLLLRQVGGTTHCPAVFLPGWAASSKVAVSSMAWSGVTSPEGWREGKLPSFQSYSLHPRVTGLAPTTLHLVFPHIFFSSEEYAAESVTHSTSKPTCLISSPPHLWLSWNFSLPHPESRISGSAIPSFRRCLPTACYVPGSVLIMRDTEINKVEKSLHLRVCIPAVEADNIIR